MMRRRGVNDFSYKIVSALVSQWVFSRGCKVKVFSGFYSNFMHLVTDGCFHVTEPGAFSGSSPSFICQEPGQIASSIEKIKIMLLGEQHALYGVDHLCSLRVRNVCACRNVNFLCFKGSYHAKTGVPVVRVLQTKVPVVQFLQTKVSVSLVYDTERIDKRSVRFSYVLIRIILVTIVGSHNVEYPPGTP